MKQLLKCEKIRKTINKRRNIKNEENIKKIYGSIKNTRTSYFTRSTCFLLSYVNNTNYYVSISSCFSFDY